MPENFERKTLSRRDFLKSSAAVTASTAISTFGAPAIIQAQSLMNPVNYGFIGSGRQGCNHLKHLSTIKTGRCAVISDIYPPNLKKGVETIGGNPETIPDKDPFAYRKLLWETTLPAAGNATPATYEVGGRQFVVIAAGGGKWGLPSGGSYIAFALPEKVIASESAR